MSHPRRGFEKRAGEDARTCVDTIAAVLWDSVGSVLRSPVSGVMQKAYTGMYYYLSSHSWREGGKAWVSQSHVGCDVGIADQLSIFACLNLF